MCRDTRQECGSFCHQTIVTKIRELLLLPQGWVTAETLAESIGVSRRTDLRALDEARRVVRVHGGVKSVEQVVGTDDLLSRRTARNAEAKQIIAEKALALLRPNTALFLDSGSTTTAVARCIPDQPMLIYTSGLHCIFCYGLLFRSAVAAAKRKGGFHLVARLVSLKAKRGFHCSASLRKREFLCRVALHCQKFSV